MRCPRKRSGFWTNTFVVHVLREQALAKSTARPCLSGGLTSESRTQTPAVCCMVSARFRVQTGNASGVTEGKIMKCEF